MANRFEEMKVWQETRNFVQNIYRTFRNNRDFGFKDQIQRAAVSILNNIAEGFERNSDPEFARFIKIAKASCGEVRSMLYVAEDLNYLPFDEAERLRAHAIKISSQLSKLYRYLKPPQTKKD